MKAYSLIVNLTLIRVICVNLWLIFFDVSLRPLRPLWLIRR